MPVKGCPYSAWCAGQANVRRLGLASTSFRQARRNSTSRGAGWRASPGWTAAAVLWLALGSLLHLQPGSHGRVATLVLLGGEGLMLTAVKRPYRDIRSLGTEQRTGRRLATDFASLGLRPLSLLSLGGTAGPRRSSTTCTTCKTPPVDHLCADTPRQRSSSGWLAFVSLTARSVNTSSHPAAVSASIWVSAGATARGCNPGCSSSQGGPVHQSMHAQPDPRRARR
jgi:hypothetical protein